ncbi:MAG: PilZ domain-containing protein, partial [Desulfofustis sp.]|nr:PilZ domain-containing protein [Desulfofustis sp.]
IVRSIKDSELAKVRITGSDGEMIHLDCIFKESDPPLFFLVFAPQAMPKDLEVGQKCSVAITRSGTADEPVTLSAAVESFKGDRSLEMRALDTIDPVSLREYFRVMVSSPIVASFEPTSDDSRQRPWQYNGMTVDLSGTGVLAVFPVEFENKHNIFLDITLPDSDKRVDCIAHVVRTRKLRKSRYQIALHFDTISRKHRDCIITACLQEQRRQLRLRMENM